jgi:type 2 lantibiotic biosynthesis protein LanM
MNLPQNNSNSALDPLIIPFLEAAAGIGRQLSRDALWDGPRCNWLGASMEYVDKAWVVVERTFGPEIYNGTAGIALFLAHLFEATGERLYRRTAEGSIRQALSRLDDISPSAHIGFYTGMTGIAYALLQLSEIFDNQQFREQALQILESLGDDDPNQQGLDVLAGSAGAIPALLSIYQRYRQDFLLDLAIQHGEHLLDTARRSDAGWSWDTLGDATQPHDLTGFSHGAGGIAWALLELFRVTQQEKFHVAAQQGFRYEQHWFNPQQENWPDFRNFGTVSQGSKETLTYMVAWCHGAPGIGLSRLRAYELLKEEVYLKEAEAALRTTTQMLQQAIFPNQGNYSLCHGNAGNAELLIYASTVLDKSDYKAIADQIGMQGIEHYQKKGIPWPCGVIGGGETPNLMLGLAGIGYFYLRLYDPAKIPSLVIIFPKIDKL